MDFDALFSAVINGGVAAAVIAYFMYRDNKYMNTITVTLTRLTEKISDVEKAIDDLNKSKGGDNIG